MEMYPYTLTRLHSEQPKLWSFGCSECNRVKYWNRGAFADSEDRSQTSLLLNPHTSPHTSACATLPTFSVSIPLVGYNQSILRCMVYDFLELLIEIFDHSLSSWAFYSNLIKVAIRPKTSKIAKTQGLTL